MSKKSAVLAAVACALAVAPAWAGAQNAAVPPGVSVGYINLDRVTSVSAEGKIATARIQALAQQKNNEIGQKQQELQGAQQKLQAGGTVLSDSARNQLQRDIDRLGLDIQRMQEDAQVEVTELQAELQADFEQKLMPVIEVIVKERGIDFLFSRVEAGIVYANPGLDLTDEVIRRFDAATAGPSSGAPSGSQPATPPAGQ